MSSDRYQILERIYESNTSLVLRARRQADNQVVVLKTTPSPYPTREELNHFQREYELTKGLQILGVVEVLGFETIDRSVAIVLEDFGAIPIKDWIPQKRIEEFLRVAIDITTTLGEIHTQHIIHKDINSNNIIINPESGEVKIIDFGIATKLSRENPTLENVNILEGTLAYISPEQTGRMNRYLDYRSDFYSLGVTFYELLSGTLPFVSNDPLELVYCHLARVPPPLPSSIPPMVRQIVLKLMAKNAEDRYQSAWGLRADLENCYRQWQRSGTIDGFELGQEDLQSHFQIPQKLYGRERELKILLDTFERQSQLLLVKGRAGLGKTRLIQEIYKPITAKQGYFVAGKGDQMARSVPYGVLISALEGLVKQVLAAKEVVWQEWRDRLLEAVGNNGMVIQSLIPSLQDLWGPQPPLVPLGAEEQQNRFHAVMQNFMAAVGQARQSVVMFLDDLQWADQASLELLGRILADDRKSALFLIGAYRDNEVDGTHPLFLSLQKWQIHPIYIELAPFSLETVTTLLADTLHTDRVGALAEFIYRRTEGNPFFVAELCQQLYQEGHLTFDRQQRAWVWEMEDIERLGISDNVVDLLLNKLRTFPEFTQHCLGIAACIGISFSASILASLTNHPPDRVFDALFPALDLGILRAVGTLNQELRLETMAFSHDRIQQASIELVHPGELSQIHYRLAQFYRESGNIFTIVDHFNQALDLVRDETERTQVAELNYQALLKAKTSVAYAAATKYGEVALQLLPESSPLFFQIDLELGSLYFLQGQFERTEALLPQLFQQCQSLTDRVGVWILQIDLYRAMNRLEEVIDVGLEALKFLGVNLPRHPQVHHIIGAILWYQWLTGRQRVESWLELPRLHHPSKSAVLQIISLISSSIFEKELKLIPIIPKETIGISLRYGTGIGSDSGVAGLALIFCGALQRMEMGNRLAKVALELAYRYPSAILPRVIFMVYTFVHHWQYPLVETLPQLSQCISRGQELGNLEMASAGAAFYCYHLFYTGAPLDRVYSECEAAACTLMRYTPLRSATTFDILKATIAHLQDKENYNPDKIESNTPPFEQFQKDFSLLFISYLSNDLATAVPIAQDLQTRETAVFGMFALVVANFYIALVYLAQMAGVPRSKRRTWQQKINKIIARMTTWARFSPANHAHRYELLKAELARVQGKTSQEGYDKSIDYARNNGFLQDEALGNELAGKFNYQLGRTRLARVYLEEACYCYDRWGAKQKVTQLQQEFAHLGSDKPSSTAPSSLTTGSSVSTILDISAVIRASQAIASEMVLDRLLVNLMDILVKNAGAEAGFLLLPPLEQWRQTDELCILATFRQGAIELYPDLKLSDWIPESLLALTVRTQTPIVLDNAKDKGEFTQDPIIQQRSVQSLLCAPLLDKGKLVGIIYLENNITTAAFTPARVEVLQLLSGQAAIAIENSYLYTNLEKTIAENLRIRSELEVAQKIQQMFLPQEREILKVKDLDIAGVMLPAEEVGGDYYDVIQIEDKTVFAVGDVTGHGLTSGVLAIVAQASLHTLSDPTDLNRINHVLYKSVSRLQSDLNMTFLVMTYCQGKITITGQHEEVLVIRSNGTIATVDTANLGFPLGLVDDISPFVCTKTIELLPQETIVLYTDGIIEAENKEREFYGNDRLKQVLQKNNAKSAQQIKDAVLTDLKQFIDNHHIFDDITLLIVKRLE